MAQPLSQPDPTAAEFFNTTNRPTEEQYTTIQQVYDFMNEALFENELPHVLITFQKKRNSYGYFAPGRWQERDNASVITDEIALNPLHLKHRTDKQIIATLVHEMVHVWQEYFGSPSRSGYHNSEWADKMEVVGLMPSDTGEVGGKRTGQHMTHYIIAGGGFERAFTRLQEEMNVRLRWVSREGDLLVPSTLLGILLGGTDPAPAGDPTQPNPPKSKNKVKYTCPGCQINVWGKPDLHLECSDCHAGLVPQL